MHTARLLFATSLARVLPETRCFGLKRRLYVWAGARIKPGVQICSSATVLGPGELEIGVNTWIGHQVLIVTGARVVIGPNVDIAPRVFIGTGTHEPGEDGKAAGAGIQRDVVIGGGAWIGAGALVLPGVEIGAGATIGAGSVVTRDIPPRAVAAGAPARVIERGESK
jgi:acetyltransferase-like isoleucine patch superfamily enzyme